MAAVRVAAQPWMSDPATRAVMAAITVGGQPARFVGGCVRDTMAGRPVKDIDIATPCPPEEIVGLLERAGLKAIPTGIDHGTVTAISGHRGFEVTTLRRDVSTDGRRAVVAFTDDWTEDAARRDLTFNAMSMDTDGTLHDPFGGLDDLAAGRVRFIGDPAVRLAEDRLRLLRFFRFLAWYGRVSPDEEALAACRAVAADLVRLSGERVRGEILRLLEAPDPMPGWHGLASVGALAVVLPEADDASRLARMATHDRALSLPAEGLLRLAAAVRPDAGLVDGLATRLRLANAERERLRDAIVTAPQLAGVDARALIGPYVRLGQNATRDAARLAAASDGDAARLARAIDLTRSPPPSLPVGGADLLARGVPPGPAIGRILDALRDWWIAGGVAAERDACLSRLDDLLERQPGGGSGGPVPPP
jgi:poly(A) polymerase